MKKLLLLAACAATMLGMSAQNPYAYKLSTTGFEEDGTLAKGVSSAVFNYNLNAPAEAVAIEILNGDEVVASFDLTDEYLSAGAHAYEVDFVGKNLPEETELTWQVKVTGAAVTAPAELTEKVLGMYSPAGVGVDVNPMSDQFGTIYVTESYASTATKYYTAPDNGTVGIGLYLFDPEFNGIKNNDGLYGFSCGMKSAGTTLVDWRPSRIQISKDNRMFILSQRVNYAVSPIFEIDRESLQASPLFVGVLDSETGKVYTDDSKETMISGGAGVAFDVTGEGEDLKIAAMYTNGTSITPGDYSTYEYNLGTATSWSEAPSRQITAFDGFALNYAGINLAYDENGGLWFSQYRGAPSPTQPAGLHTSDMANVDWSDITSICRNGGMAYNKDKTLFAYVTANKTIKVYNVTMTDNGPQLAELYTVSCPSFTGFNQIAFDYANNIISCDNSAEKFGMFVTPNVTTVNAPFAADAAVEPVITPAQGKYSFNLKSGINTGITRANTGKQIVATRYYNLQGVESATPFQGVNIVVNEMNDGSKVTTKVIK